MVKFTEIKKLGSTAAGMPIVQRLVDKIWGTETAKIDDPVDWGSQAKLIEAVGVSGPTQFTMANSIMHQPRILRSTRW
ncbi:MAG: hypothetical protein ACJ0A9_03120, partial [Dehalococcoidia bacterium]